jgi:thymidine kinase
MSASSNNSLKQGILEVICGPMFSGKSEELIRRLRRAKIAQQRVGVFKHRLDEKRTTAGVVSHNGSTIEAFATDQPKDIITQVQEHNITVIGIDEVQFFSNDIISVICQLINQGKRVVVAGLDTDFRCLPFGPMPTLLAIADKATKLQAICTLCGSEASCTQRLVDGKPAKHNDPIILVGAQEAYQARCRSCYSIDKLALL